MKVFHSVSSAGYRLCAVPGVHLGLLLAAIAIFYGSTIRDGHVWADDFAMYLHHAKNLAEWKPYADTGYIYNPAVPRYGPRVYPPIFPVMLAPLYRAFGLNLIPMKMEQTLFLLGALLAMYFLWRPELGHGYSLAVVGIVGFNPKFWAAKDDVTSDLLFLCFFYLVALVGERSPCDEKTWLRRALVTGFLLYLTSGTRTIGIALVPGLVLYHLIRHRKVTRFAIVASMVWLCSTVAQSQLIGHGESSYLDQALPTVQATAENARQYLRTLAAFWTASTHNVFAVAVLPVVALLTFVGLQLRWHRGPSAVEAFLPIYLFALILFPHPIGIRGTFPLLAWTVFLALAGLRTLMLRAKPKYVSAATCALLTLIAATYVMGYRQTDFGPIHEQSGMPEFNQLCQAIRSNTGSGDVLISYRPRALSLYTGRAGSTYDRFGTEDELWRWARGIRATYVVTTDSFSEDEGFLRRFVNGYPTRFDPVYRNAAFTLYRVATIPE